MTSTAATSSSSGSVDAQAIPIGSRAASATDASSASNCSSASGFLPESATLAPDDYWKPDDDRVLAKFSQFDFVRFTFADINGLARSKMVSGRSVHQPLKEGVFLFAGCLGASTRSEATPVEEVLRLNYGNCAVRAMPGTLRHLPWATDGRFRVGEVLCETFWISPFRNGAHQDACPRYMARKQLERLKELKYALYSAFEAEYMVFKRGTLTPVIEGMDVTTTLRQAQMEDYACAVDNLLFQSDVKCSGFLVEHGAGQMEFTLDPLFGVKAADQLFCFKQSIKELTLKPHLDSPRESVGECQRARNAPPSRDWQATFMTQPFPEASNNGLHFNHSIWSLDGTKNQFSDSSDPDGLSGLARHWVAGLTKHARALSALCCPTVNCYRRLFTPWAPEKNNWGIDDRFACFRVKAYGSKSAHVESRLPSGAANPYLVLAATVAAGLDGIVNRLECPPSREQDTTASADLPRSLGEALKALEEDDWMRESLGEEFLRWFVQMKNESEIKLIEAKDDVELDPKARFEMERELYFELI